MQKKVVIVLAIIVVIVLGCGLWWFGGQSKKEPLVAPVVVEKSTPTVSPKILTWNDPAGFTFLYDASLKINNHPEDKENYANLTITGEKTGSITILASDTKLKSTADWEKGQTKAEKAVLGGKEAKLITLNVGKTTIGAIDSGILFTIEMEPGSDSVAWQKHFDKIVSSWTFVYPTSVPASSGGGQSSGGDIVEEEEIIQ